MENEINEIYLKVDDLFSIKVKQQILNSGLHFRKFLLMNDLVTGESYYALLINENAIQFKNQTELFIRLIEFINQELELIKSDFDYYNNEKSKFKIDENSQFNIYEDLGRREDKLTQILDKIKKGLDSIVRNV